MKNERKRRNGEKHRRLVNGYKIPENYKIEDLRFMNLEIDIR